MLELKVDKFLTYHNDIIIIQYANYGEDNRNLGDLMDWLGELGFVQCNELYQGCVADDCGNLFEFSNSDEMVLAREGEVTLKLSGETLTDYKNSNEDFYNWFWNIK